MTLLKFLKPRESLPDPKGQLSATAKSSAIASVNREVEAELLDMAKQKERKRGPYGRQANRVNYIGWNC